MRTFFRLLTLMFFTLTACAESDSELGLDYLELTGSELLAEILYETEPYLITSYNTREWTKAYEKKASGMKTLATLFTRDEANKSWMRFYEKSAPDIPLRFLKLNKDEFPNLWDWGELIRLRIETARIERERLESIRLYEALHGKPYDGRFLEKTN